MDALNTLWSKVIAVGENLVVFVGSTVLEHGDMESEFSFVWLVVSDMLSVLLLPPTLARFFYLYSGK